MSWSTPVTSLCSPSQIRAISCAYVRGPLASPCKSTPDHLGNICDTAHSFRFIPLRRLRELCATRCFPFDLSATPNSLPIWKYVELPDSHSPNPLSPNPNSLFPVSNLIGNSPVSFPSTGNSAFTPFAHPFPAILHLPSSPSRHPIHPLPHAICCKYPQISPKLPKYLQTVGMRLRQGAALHAFPSSSCPSAPKPGRRAPPTEQIPPTEH